MTVPAYSARQTPAGIRIPEGFSAKVTFGSIPTLSLWEVQVKPPKIDNGEPINISTMHNAAVHTKYPRKLVDIGDASMECAYDPDVLATIFAMCGRPDTVSWLYPDGSTQAAYAYLRTFEPKELKEGDFPMATVTITIMNYDATAHVEAVPVYTTAPGT